ncbi:KIN14H [Symbiodinium sp. CCMP2592]|nr:KIN14H [Symbiodinium sp. CCMP2592]
MAQPEAGQLSEQVIKQVCATLRQWSLEGPPRNPRRTAGELAVSLEAALGPATETSLKEDGVQTDPEKNEAGELRQLLGELRLEYEDLNTESQQRGDELLAVKTSKADLQAKLEEAAQRQAASEVERAEVCQLRRRVTALSAHLSSVLTPVSAACRTRPLSSYKESELGTRALSVDGTEITVEDSLGRSRKFKVDRILDDSKQEDLFLAAAPWVEHAASGGSSCVFAYGATGSGKTHSILGEGDETRPGLAHHAIRRLIEGQSCGEVRISMLEVYCEQIRDLLGASEGGTQPKLLCSRRDGEGRMLLDCVEAVASASDVDALLARGFANRATEGTLCNDSSSRSHVVLTVKAVEPGRGRLVLVDLAGSENVQRSGADEDAKLLAEAKAINRSLSALADVVEATAKQQNFIPYRNSRLTMLLEEALCMSRVLLLVHISPFARDATDTAHSLNFASRVRAVDFGAQRLRQDQEDRARAAQNRSQQEARLLQQQLDQTKRELTDSQKVQSELKQQVSHLGEQLRERQRELMREQERRSQAEDCARDLRLAGRSEAFTNGSQGRPISPVPRSLSAPRLGNAAKPREKTPAAKATTTVEPRGIAPAKQRPTPQPGLMNRGFLEEEPEVLDTVSPSKAQTGDLPPRSRKPFLDRTNENDADVLNSKMLLSPTKVDFTSPTKMIKDLGTPTRGSILTPERLSTLSPCANVEVNALGAAAEMRVKTSPPRKALQYNSAQVRSVLKKMPTDFKSRLLKKQELGAAFTTGDKHVTFAEQEQTACSPPRWYLDLLEYEQSCKQADSKAETARNPRGRSLTPPQRRRTEVQIEGAGPRWRH